MTTILAIRGKDGVVMCADTRASSYMTWEYANKLTPIGKSVLLGCAGTDIYISQFTRFIHNEFEKPDNRDLFSIINDAILLYSESIYDNNKRTGLADPRYLPFEGIDTENICYPEGVLVAYDSTARNYRIFKLKPPHPPNEVDYPNRATAGSGSVAAAVFLKNTEFLLGKVGKVGYDWGHLSTHLIAQFCFILMHRIAYVEPHTSGVQAYRLNESGWEALSQDKVFGKLEKGDHYLRVLIDSAIDEIGADKLAPLAGEYMLQNLLRKVRPILA